MTTFFIGCTHFDHANIIRLASRPFDHVEEMNQKMIEAWNNRVAPNDTVFHLGDVGFIKDEARLSEILSRLNGQLHLRWGNHDAPIVREHARWVTSQPYSEEEIEGRRFVLFHYPIEEWNGFYKGSVHLHCHTHNDSKFGATLRSNRVNVSVEAWDYAPIPVEEILAVWSA